MRSCIMPGLLTHSVQKLNVGIVQGPLGSYACENPWGYSASPRYTLDISLGSEGLSII